MFLTLTRGRVRFTTTLGENQFALINILCNFKFNIIHRKFSLHRTIYKSCDNINKSNLCVITIQDSLTPTHI